MLAGQITRLRTCLMFRHNRNDLLFREPPRGKGFLTLMTGRSGAGMHSAFDCGLFNAAGLDEVRGSDPDRSTRFLSGIH
ncbi:hypothetical protein ACWTU6_30045 [Mesorhizobium sp. BHbsci]